MRVLFIGGTAFIGPHVARLLLAAGHEVAVFHRGQHEAGVPEGVVHFHDGAAAWPITHFPGELQRWDPEVVLHMVPMGESDAVAAVQAFRHVSRRLVGISSADVYRAYGVLMRKDNGAPDPVPLAEDAPLRTDLYPYRAMAKAPDDWMHDYEKILAERALVTEPALPATILRLPAVYGASDHHRLLPWLKRMLDGRPAILIGEAEANWRWTHGYVEDVAAAIAAAVMDDRASARIYNVGEASPPTTLERVQQLASASGWRGEVRVLPGDRLPLHLQHSFNFAQSLVTDTSRIRAELGYAERVPISDALHRTVEWYRENPPAQFNAALFDYAAEDAALEANA